MKFTIERAALITALSHVTGVVERRNTIPVLNNVLISAADNSIQITATDLDIVATDVVTAEISALGTTTVDAGILFDIARKLPNGGLVSAELDNHNLHISCGSAQFALACLPPEDFPVMDTGNFDHEFSLPKTDLSKLINKTKFAQSTEETRFYLNGLYFHLMDGNVSTVATDGHRLGKYAVACPDGAVGMSGVIIPRKTVAEALKMVDGDGDVSVKVSDTKIQFLTGGMVLTSKLVDGVFPDYDRVIPKSNPNILTVSVKALKNAVDRVSTVATDKTRAVKLYLTVGSLELSVVSVDSGTATETILVDYNGEPMEIGCNAKYLIESLSVISGESVTFELDNGGSPMVLKDTSDSEFIGVLMPMRV